jgi:hypothetical protein
MREQQLHITRTGDMHEQGPGPFCFVFTLTILKKVELSRAHAMAGDGSRARERAGRHRAERDRALARHDDGTMEASVRVASDLGPLFL